MTTGRYTAQPLPRDWNNSPTSRDLLEIRLYLPIAYYWLTMAYLKFFCRASILAFYTKAKAYCYLACFFLLVMSTT